MPLAVYWSSSTIISSRRLRIVGDPAYCSLSLAFFRKSTTSSIRALFSLASQEALTACNSRPSCTSSRLPLGLAITDNWSRTRSADWSISVMFANGLKRRVSPSRYTPPMFSHRDLYPSPMSNTTAKPPESSTLRISGCISPVLPAPEVPQTAML